MEMAKQTFTGSRFANGRLWQRVCQECQAVQPDGAVVNSPCCKCGGEIIMWIPKKEEKNDE